MLPLNKCYRKHRGGTKCWKKKHVQNVKETIDQGSPVNDKRRSTMLMN